MKQELSDELLNYYYGFLEADWQDDIPPEEREEAERLRSIAADFAKIIVLSRVRLSQIDMNLIDSVVQSNKKLCQSLLNTYYTIEQLENISCLIRRTLQLSALTAKDTPSAQTNLYISEASKAYIHGFQNASVAMSRAALEQALKERLGRQGDGEENMLGLLIKDAKKWNILSNTGSECAWDLKEKSNIVLHESPVKNQNAALEILIGVRSLLEEIYSADGHY